MEHIENTPPEVATYEPASHSSPAVAGEGNHPQDGGGGFLPLVHESNQLTDPLVEDAVAAGRGNRPGWSDRRNGWTDDRIRTFLAVLSQCGVVADACRAVSLSQQSAYAFRNGRHGRAFDVAWRAAQLAARQRLADHLISRALNGYVELIRRDGEVVAERHRYDNRLSMAVLTRLDHLAQADRRQDEAACAVVGELEDYVDSLCAGPEAAAAFIESRCALPDQAVEEEKIIPRIEFLRPIVDPPNRAETPPRDESAMAEPELDPRPTELAAMQRPGAGAGPEASAAFIDSRCTPSDQTANEEKVIRRIERVIVEPPVRAIPPHEFVGIARRFQVRPGDEPAAAMTAVGGGGGSGEDDHARQPGGGEATPDDEWQPSTSSTS